VCTAFNADFDGDQMAVHVPLSMEAQLEAQVLMLSANNILSPSNGAPIAVPTQDMVLGIYYLTKEKLSTPGHPVRGEGRLFADPEKVRNAYYNEDIDRQARIRRRWNGEFRETTVGRTLFNEVVPEPLRFVNQELKKKEVTALVSRCMNMLGNEATVQFLDELKDLGFRYATLSGLSIGIDDMHIPSSKERHITQAREQVNEVEQQYQDGVITNGERYNKVVDIWAHTTELIAEEMFRELEGGEQGGEFNPIYMMADSGARGSKQQIRQLAGRRRRHHPVAQGPRPRPRGGGRRAGSAVERDHRAGQQRDHRGDVTEDRGLGPRARAHPFRPHLRLQARHLRALLWP